MKTNKTLQTDNLTAEQNAAKLTTHSAVKQPLSWGVRFSNHDCLDISQYAL